MSVFVNADTYDFKSETKVMIQWLTGPTTQKSAIDDMDCCS